MCIVFNVQKFQLICRNNIIFVFLFFALEVLCVFCHEEFGYDGLQGPENWGKDFQNCTGKHQSPINIDEHNVINLSLPDLKFSGLRKGRGPYIMNNGHTIVLKFNNSMSIIVSGGPLGANKYVFDNLHFHWGKNDHEGSEDRINNHSFAMELHVVLFKKSYRKITKAIDYPDGLAVLAYFFEVKKRDNPTYKAIVDALPSVKSPGMRRKLHEPLSIKPMVKPAHLDLDDYFTYDGSLTTPPCTEVVTWIDFKDSLSLSHRQIAEFRKVRSADGQKLTHNFRPPQPLGGRKIYHNIPCEDDY